MASASKPIEQHIHDLNISGHSRTHIGHHYGDNNFFSQPGRPDHHAMSSTGQRLTVSERPETPPLPFSNVPFPRDDNFVDRPSIMGEMERKLERKGGRVALVGLGGVGLVQAIVFLLFDL